jgi:ATP-dependent Zn protease
MILLDRIRFILLFLVVWVVLVITEVGNNPLLSVGDALRKGLRTNWWMLVLVALEVIRQIHYWISEKSAVYHRSWQGFWKGFEGVRNKFPPLLRFRLARIARILVFLTLLAIVLGKITGESPFTALFKAPAMVVQALPSILQVLLIMLVAVGQFVAIFWYLSRGGVETYMPDEINTRFSDVWGQDNVLHRVKENVALLEKPELVEAKGGQVPRGILLWGPPGTGKTLIAKAVAGETGKPFVFVEPSSFNQMFVGVGAMKVKALYKKLRKLALRYGGVIVFFDEADVLGSRGAPSGGFGGLGGAGGYAFGDKECGGFGYLSERAQMHILRANGMGAAPASPAPPNNFIMGGMGGGGGMGVLQPLLTEMSGMEKPRGLVNKIRKLLGLRPVPPPLYRILTIMATNLPDALDPALLRPGRIDRIFKVGYPPLEGRIQTYNGYLRKVKHELTEEQVRRFALTSGRASGAQIESFVNEALIIAIRDGRDTITWADLELAKFHRRFGMPDQHQYTDRDRHSVAIHEAGHAVAAYRLDYTSVVDVANIEKRGQVGGFVARAPLEDSEKDWTHNLEINIKVSLASRASERLFFGENSSGVGGDMNSATSLAMLMLGNWAMGDFLASHGATFEAMEGAQPGMPDRAVHDRPFGGRVEAQLKVFYDEIYLLMEENRTELLSVAHALEVHGAISGSDVEAVMERRQGPVVDGRVYGDPTFLAELEAYHAEVMAMLRVRGPVEIRLPVREPPPQLALVASTPYQNGHGNGNGTWGPPPPPAWPPTPAPAPAPGSWGAPPPPPAWQPPAPPPPPPPPSSPSSA